MTPETERILAEIRALRAEVTALAARSPSADLIVSRDEAAAMIKVSVRQLQRLVRAGRLLAHPSGIARDELERYAKTPQTKLTAGRSKPRTGVVEEAADLRALLKLRRKRRS